jgi:hypothetical protein
MLSPPTALRAGPAPLTFCLARRPGAMDEVKKAILEDSHDIPIRHAPVRHG